MHIKRIVSRLLLPTLFICFLFSCDRKLDRQFDEIEATLSQNPQAAYEKLSELSLQELGTRRARARYALLMSLAQDKSYIDVDNDSLVRISVNYYQNGNDAFHKMLSLYSLGIVQKNAGNNTLAIISFLRAKEEAEEIDDYHYLGLINRNIASLYRWSGDVDQELFYIQESFLAFDKLEEKLYAEYSRLEKGRAVMAKGLYNQADSILRQVEVFARNNDRQLLRQVLMDRAVNSMSSGFKDAKQAISLYNEVDNLGGGQKETVDYGTLAMAYDLIGETDSVTYYMSVAEKSARTSLDSVHLCNTLASIFNSHGDYVAANEQYKKGVGIHNRMVYNQEHQRIANAINDYNREEASRQSMLARNRLTLLILLSIIIIILFIAIVLSINLRRRQVFEKNRIIKEKELKIEEDMAQIQGIAEELASYRNTQSDMSKTIGELIKEKISIVKRCADAYEKVVNPPKLDPKNPYFYLDENPLQKKEDTIKEFLKALDGFRKDETLFSELENSVNKWRNGLMEKLRENCSVREMGKPQFKEEDFRILMLSYAGVPDRTIAFLLGMTYAAIRTRKARCKERLLKPDIRDGAFFVGEMSSTSIW